MPAPPDQPDDVEDLARALKRPQLRAPLIIAPLSQPDDVEAIARALKRPQLRGPIIVLAITTTTLAAGALATRPPTVADLERSADFTFQDGDLVFQSCGGPLCKVIEGVTHSPLSHVGLVDTTTPEPTIIEAFGPVGAVPLTTFLRRSRGEVVVMRFIGPAAEQVPAIKRELTTFHGRPYDARYRWDDEAIYCTELIYKAVHQATGIELAPLVPLGELDYRAYRDFIIKREGHLPLDREMITPADLRRSPHLQQIATTMPPRATPPHPP